MSEERVLERVRKMLALANDAAATEGERENAMRMAYKTLAAHNLSLSQVGTSASAQEARAQASLTLEMYPWVRTIAGALAGLFFCEYLYVQFPGSKKGSHYFVGRESNGITASELTVYVVRSVMKESVRRYNSATSPEACAFDKGAAARISHRCFLLRQEAQEENAQAASTGRELVLASLYDTEHTANREWIAQTYSKGVKVSKDRQRDIRHPEAYRSGTEFGKTVSLNRQVGTSDKPKAIK